MAEFIEVAGADQLQSGRIKAFNIGDREILIARVGESFYAAARRCPHMGGDLAEGKLDGTIITCPRHHSQFDLTDGHNVRWTDWTGIKLGVGKVLKSPRPLRTYPVKVDGGKVLVGMERVPAAVS
jgi:3-phenylpropionate/trans-cinnamate dioxygenase ferredoxin subunit